MTRIVGDQDPVISPSLVDSSIFEPILCSAASGGGGDESCNFNVVSR